MAKRLVSLTKNKINPKIVAGVIILIGLVGLSFISASLLNSVVNIAISNTNDNPKGGGNSEPGLIAYYPFDDGSGNIASEKMIQNNGTIFGAQWTNNALLGKALNFTGPNNYIEIPDNAVLNPTDAITVSVWVKLNKTVAEQTYQYIIINKSNWNNKEGYQLLFNKPYTNNLIFRILYENTYKDVAWDASNLKKDVWYHIVGAYDKSKSELSLYVDGYLKNVNFLNTPIDVTINKLYISGTGNNYFDGSIDEVKVYFKALTDEEIMDLYENTRCKRYSGINLSDLDSKQYEYLTSYPLKLNTGDINNIKNNYPWINPDNPSECDKIFIMGMTDAIINSTFSPY
jgi:hypothetical protein